MKVGERKTERQNKKKKARTTTRNELINLPTPCGSGRVDGSNAPCSLDPRGRGTFPFPIPGARAKRLQPRRGLPAAPLENSKTNIKPG